MGKKQNERNRERVMLICFNKKHYQLAHLCPYINQKKSLSS